MACPTRRVLLGAASVQCATGLASRVEEERVTANFRTCLRHRLPRSSRVALRLVPRARQQRKQKPGRSLLAAWNLSSSGRQYLPADSTRWRCDKKHKDLLVSFSTCILLQ